MHELCDRFGIVPPARPQPTVIIGDFGKDLDDEHALVLAAGLQRMGFIELRAVVGNLEPAHTRARLARGTLAELGFPAVPVGVGSAVVSGDRAYPYELDVPYLAAEDTVVPGSTLLVQVLREATEHSVTLILQSGMTDAAALLHAEPELVREKVRLVAIMGGVEVRGDDVVLVSDRSVRPNNAANNAFDPFAAFYVYVRLQEYGVPVQVLTRDAVFAAPIPMTAYDRMCTTRIGSCLAERYRRQVQAFWRSANILSERPAMLRDRDRAWFVRAFCAGRDPGPAVDADDDITPHIPSFPLYDPLNLAAAIPAVRERFFQPWEGSATPISVIGISRNRNSVSDASGLSSFVIEVESAALNARSA